jgi:hypothetical protein
MGSAGLSTKYGPMPGIALTGCKKNRSLSYRCRVRMIRMKTFFAVEFAALLWEKRFSGLPESAKCEITIARTVEGR